MGRMNPPYDRSKRPDKGPPSSDQHTRVLLERIAELESELDRYRSGFQGSCYACEGVGEKNMELERQLAKTRGALAAIAAQRPDKYICHEIASKALAGGE